MSFMCLLEDEFKPNTAKCLLNKYYVSLVLRPDKFIFIFLNIYVFVIPPDSLIISFSMTMRFLNDLFIYLE